jgi:pyridinium-3,5-biscarboxylic acid mononucleotide sulfurtransferase
MTNSYIDRVQKLRRHLEGLGGAVVAFSGGVDSALLVSLAHEILGSRMLAATAASASLPELDRELITNFCTENSIPHRFIETCEFSDPKFINNPEDRCYHCKSHLYDGMISLADELNLPTIIEGTNASDLSGHRPGHGASKERERVSTPLVHAGLTKDDVRKLARERSLPQADKPSAACLASRIPTGQALTPELMCRIDRAEQVLKSAGVGQVRVRHHGNIARVEVDPQDIALCFENREMIVAKLKKLGWQFITIDLVGYRTGGMEG